MKYKLTACVLFVGMLSGCGAVFVGDYIAGRASLENQNISDQDYQDLRSGRILDVKRRYEALAPDQRTPQQTSLLCDIYLKLQDIPQAAACNTSLAKVLTINSDPKLRARSHSRLAQIAFAKQKYTEAANELVEASKLLRDTDESVKTNEPVSIKDDGILYLMALINARTGEINSRPEDIAAAQATAVTFAKQFNPRSVFYAATIFAAIRDFDAAIKLLQDPGLLNKLVPREPSRLKPFFRMVFCKS
ncbi:hypothetical protein TI04_11740 [Achromatium sp. WMS2]|nr:hypothetical protein TI04_11740 [Achromatium sp. WMS2]